MTWVVDASIALKWYVESPGSREAVQVLERDEELIAPDLVVAEVANAAWKLVRAGHIERDHGDQIANAVASAFPRLVAAEELAGRAFRLAASLDHPVYDCLYLALAEQKRAHLVTADLRLQRRLEGTRWSQLLLPRQTS